MADRGSNGADAGQENDSEHSDDSQEDVNSSSVKETSSSSSAEAEESTTPADTTSSSSKDQTATSTSSSSNHEEESSKTSSDSTTTQHRVTSSEPSPTSLSISEDSDNGDASSAPTVSRDESESSSASSATTSTSSRASSTSPLSSSFATLSRSDVLSSPETLNVITASIDNVSASATSDDDDASVIATGTIIGIVVGGVVALCLLLAIVGRSRFLIAKWAKRGQRHSHIAGLALNPSPTTSMHDTSEGHTTMNEPPKDANAVDFLPAPLYAIQDAYAHRSSTSLHSRRSSARGLEFSHVRPTNSSLGACQPAYPPLSHHTYRQNTFSDFGRGEQHEQGSILFAPSSPHQPWFENESKRGSGSNVSLNSNTPMLSAPREPRRSSTMPMTYHRPTADSWASVPIPTATGTPSPPLPSTPRIGSPLLVHHAPESRASMRASVYDALNRSSTRSPVTDYNGVSRAFDVNLLLLQGHSGSF